MREVLLLGEDNPLSADPEFALYCRPARCSGDRLRRILGLSEDAYLDLRRENLCASNAWSLGVARQRVRELDVLLDRSHVVVMLGRKVATAFDYDRPFFTHALRNGRLQLVSLPHPSGRNTVWNHQALRLRAREILRELAPGVPWGSADDQQEAA